MTDGNPRTRVVYLFGAGASHGSAKAEGSAYGILMRDLGDPLQERIRQLAATDYADDRDLTQLFNTVVIQDTDIEHIITFLDQSSSHRLRKVAADLRKVFEAALTSRLDEIEEELGAPPVGLYDALLDLYEVEDFEEELRGVLTLNYDGYIEAAVAKTGRGVNFGIEFAQAGEPAYELLKLHGSFAWEYAWPAVPRATGREPLWIPPGIQKAKDEYPFNLLWGRAREILDCDVLRIVGCRISPNDWDLISLLFTTRHANVTRTEPYRIELINSPRDGRRIRGEYPYLDVQSVLEHDPIGSRLISEFLGSEPRSYEALRREEREELDERSANANWFRLWLLHMAEVTFERLGSLDTPRGVIRTFVEEG